MDGGIVLEGDDFYSGDTLGRALHERLLISKIF
jgi:hypothetical protein